MAINKKSNTILFTLMFLYPLYASSNYVFRAPVIGIKHSETLSPPFNEYNENNESNSCFNADNIGKIGELSWEGNCGGMLIVDNIMLHQAGSETDNSGFRVTTGDESFRIFHDETNTYYTFHNDQYNIFTGQVTDLAGLFLLTDFDGDIGYWNTSNVTTLESTFEYAESFDNGGMSLQWDTSNVSNFDFVFIHAHAFNRDIGNWDTSNATTMWTMFAYASSFNHSLSNWDVSNVAQMDLMFYNATSFNQDLSSWCPNDITSEPFYFDYGANAWSLPKPSWGNCN